VNPPFSVTGGLNPYKINIYPWLMESVFAICYRISCLKIYKIKIFTGLSINIPQERYYWKFIV
jgi:hypothetical protein